MSNFIYGGGVYTSILRDIVILHLYNFENNCIINLYCITGQMALFNHCVY